MKYKSLYEQALAQQNGRWLREQLIRLRSEGISRETLMADLWEFHEQLENETDQDFIKDILDLFYGWCAPQFRID